MQKLSVNHFMVGSWRILDYVVVGLHRLHCTLQTSVTGQMHVVGCRKVFKGGEEEQILCHNVWVGNDCIETRGV